MSDFSYEPSPHVPFRDRAAIARCRAIRRDDLAKHPNPLLHIRIVPDEDIGFLWIADMFHRIKAAADEGRALVMILPNPCPAYRHLARLINLFGIDCRKLVLFAMDEYADQDGRVAPADWPKGFGYAMRRHLVDGIEERLRPPASQVHGFTTGNCSAYGRMIEDAGNADIVYSGPGWTGHLAFIEPDAPEFDAPLEEWMRMGPRIVTLSPYTLAQNSLHGSFGMSGDLAAVPPKAATIGPAQVVAARERMEIHNLGIHGTATSWQRMISRLCLHGPVTPRLPSSIHQLLGAEVLVSETIAADISDDSGKEY
jgi:glucosamine-6-phosphate deaminase